MSSSSRVVANAPNTSSVPLREAQEILGDNFFTLDASEQILERRLTNTEYQRSCRLPWPREVLSGRCPFFKEAMLCETHVAYFGLGSQRAHPLTLATWPSVELHLGFAPRVDQGHDWYYDHPIATQAVLDPCWHLVLASSPGSLTWIGDTEQLQVLPAPYRPASCMEEIMKNLLLSVGRDRHGAAGRFARCRERPALGTVCCVSGPDRAGSLVGIWDGAPRPDVGMAVARFPGC